jgi:cytochrome c
MNHILQIPIPRDIPLDLPLAHWLLVFLLILSFLIHILFINLMIGGSILTLWYEIKGLKKKKYDFLSKEIANTITVNKSLAIVLGVAPLLTINVLYTIYFYTANALTGLMWISIVPWVAVAFLFLYAHKFLWQKLENNKALHIGFIAVAVASFLFIPLIFLSNINIMLFPEKWETINGFISTLTMSNVFPRYFHFITASIAITGLFLVYFFKRNSYKIPKEFEDISKPELIKNGYNITFLATLLQFIFGPILFLTLPTKGINWTLFFVIILGVSFAIAGIFYLWKEINFQKEIGKYFLPIVIIFGITVVFMGTGRHIYRSNALQPHQELIYARSVTHQRLVEKAIAGELESKTVITSTSGKELFETNCIVCHDMNKRLVGPPLSEIVSIYQGEKDKLKKWIVAPGRKRDDYPSMTPFPNLTENELNKIADYFLRLK